MELKTDDEFEKLMVTQSQTSALNAGHDVARNPTAVSGSSAEIARRQQQYNETSSMLRADDTDVTPSTSTQKKQRIESGHPKDETRHVESSSASTSVSQNTVESKIYSCPVCNRGFSRQYILTAHSKTHGERPFKCTMPMCEKAFKTKGNFNRHFRTHTGEKSYTCTFYGRGFAANDALQRHFRMHTGVMPYKCEYEACDASFASMSNLRRHSLTAHTSITERTCPICKQTFRWQHNLRSHMNAHKRKGEVS